MEGYDLKKAIKLVERVFFFAVVKFFCLKSNNGLKLSCKKDLKARYMYFYLIYYR